MQADTYLLDEPIPTIEQIRNQKVIGKTPQKAVVWGIAKVPTVAVRLFTSNHSCCCSD
jgi:hypothetical protein